MTPIFPGTYSTLCPVALSELIAAQYGIQDVQCKLLVRGVGDTYRIESENGCFILRIYRSSHRSLDHIREEVRLLQALKEGQVSVSYPIADLSGQTILKLNAIEGERHAVLFSYAKGKVVRAMNENQLHILGNEMARFHHVSSDFKVEYERWNFDLQTTVFKPLERLKPFFTENPEDYEWLQAIGVQVERRLAAFDMSEFSKGYCHFDFLPKNFHFDHDTVTFFDFDFMGYGCLVNDIMTCWLHFVLEVSAGRMTYEELQNAYHIFLDAYKEYRTVSPEELASVPYLAIGFWLFYMSFHTTHDQFSIFSQPAHLKLYVGIMRNIVENYWEKQV